MDHSGKTKQEHKALCSVVNLSYSFLVKNLDLKFHLRDTVHNLQAIWNNVASLPDNSLSNPLKLF